MSIKMSKCKRISNNEKVNVNEINDSEHYKKKYRGNLKCFYCNAIIIFKDTHLRHRRDGGFTEVKKYFSLKQHEHHSEECTYNIKKQIDILVAESTNIENIIPIFDRDNQDTTFRLNILLESLRTAENINSKSTENEKNAVYESTNYVLNGEVLNSYINSATGVAKLRSKIEDDEELENEIKILFNNKNIQWNEFYFDPLSYPLINENIDYPIAMNITVKTKMNHKYKMATIFQCYSTDLEIVYNTDNVIVPKLYIHNDNILDYIQEKEEYLIVAKPIININEKFLNIELHIYNRCQIKKVE
jgi:hypothetical protein